MPLHLLSKKSWNVWNADNISRVDRDIARGEAIEAEQDQALREYDSLRQLAVLRGEAPPTPPRILSTEEIEQRVRDEARGERSADGAKTRKKRKLQGEDETDMELRLAREAAEERYGETEKKERGSREKRRKIDAPITDPNGHINLFPIDPRDLAKQKNAEAEAEKTKKNKELEDQYTMRFSNAAGRDGFKEQPWYANKDEKRQRQEEERGEDSSLTYMEYKNLWGKPDPKRKDRELTRASASDPMAMMQKAQSQLKRSEKDKQTWTDQRAKELARLNEDLRRDEQKHRHKRRHRRSDEHDERKPDNGHSHKTSRTKPRELAHIREDLERSERRHDKSGHLESPMIEYQEKYSNRHHRVQEIDDLEPFSLDAPPPELSTHKSDSSSRKTNRHSADIPRSQYPRHLDPRDIDGRAERSRPERDRNHGNEPKRPRNRESERDRDHESKRGRHDSRT